MHAADTSAGADTQAALPGLPLDVLNTHILSKLSDPIDFARFRAVSASLRDAVDATGCEIKEFSIFQAAKLGHLSTLQHKLQGVPIVPRVWELALEGGHLEVLKWLRAEGVLGGRRACGVWEGETCARAAKYGHLEVLKWLHANGCPWDEGTCNSAAEYGHFEILKWAHAKDCPWSEITCELAAKGAYKEGEEIKFNLDILKWLRVKKCPWDKETYLRAEHYRPGMYQWIIANSCPEASENDYDWEAPGGGPWFEDPEEEDDEYPYEWAQHLKEITDRIEARKKARCS